MTGSTALPAVLPTPSSAPAGLAAALAARPGLWAHLVQFRAESRWTHLLDTATLTPALDAAPDTALPAGLVAARDGRAPRQSTADLGAGRVRAFGRHHVHQVVNTLHEPAVSLHVHAPRLTLMNTYRVDERGLVRTGTQQAGVDW